MTGTRKPDDIHLQASPEPGLYLYPTGNPVWQAWAELQVYLRSVFGRKDPASDSGKGPQLPKPWGW